MPGLTLELLLDIILAAALIGLGWIVLTSRDLFRGVVLFIVFGLLMSLVWLRLGAPDIALAEAAIGTGLTAALLLEAVRQIENPREEDTEDQGMDRDEGTPHAE
jgi:energy-converting hydrogenase B subunit D